MYNNKLKIIRKTQGLTIKELSKLSGVSIGYICHLENGTRKNPSKKVMEKIAKVLHENILEIFY